MVVPRKKRVNSQVYLKVCFFIYLLNAIAQIASYHLLDAGHLPFRYYVFIHFALFFGLFYPFWAFGEKLFTRFIYLIVSSMLWSVVVPFCPRWYIYPT
jgi:hypothetical protein